jgi:transposase
MRFFEVNERFSRQELTCEQAAEVMGVSVSTFYRKRQRFAEEGAEGLVDRRIGKISARRVPVDEAMRVIALFETKYCDFTVKHFHEKLVEQGYKHSYTLLKNTLQQAGVVKKVRKRGQHRRKRPRRPLPGIMLHQDGSTHEWVPGKRWDLIVTMDDATNEIYSMFFCEEEGTMSSFQGLSETMKKQGMPCSLYVDRGSHYFFTPKAGEKVDKGRLTQVGRAMRQLGIEMIPAYSPEARGRSERMFGTLQKRLPQELRLQGITDMAQANRFLRDSFLPAHNARFAKAAEVEGSAFTPLYDFALDEVLCIQEERVVSNDNTVKYKNSTLQIIPGNNRLHYVKSKVRIHEYQDKSLAIFHGPRRLESVLLEKQGHKEEDLSDAFIALVPSSEGKKAEGEATPSPSPDLGNHHGAQVTRQCCPILRTAQNLSART